MMCKGILDVIISKNNNKKMNKQLISSKSKIISLKVSELKEK